VHTAAISAFAIALLVCVGWLIFRPGFDSGAATAAALAALVSSWFLGRDKPSAGQAQHVSGGSFGVQAGRDASVRDSNER
jgi:hypothetical protein